MPTTRETRPDRPPWSWPGAVALVIGSCLGFGWAAALIVSAAVPAPVSEAGLNMLSSLGQTMAGAVAAYLGYQIGSSGHGAGRRDQREDDDARDTP